MEPGSNQKNLNKKILASFVLLVLFSNLFFSIASAPKVAQAYYPVMDSPLWGKSWYDTALDKIWKAFNTAQTYLQTGYQHILTGLGISKAVEEKIEKALKWAWNTFRKTLLNMLVDDIIRWVQGGGKPRIVTDWQGFLKTAADRAGGAFVEDYLKAGYLCKSFRGGLQILLAQVPTFDKASTCTISQIVSNIEDFFNDFNRGGWKAWITVSETQNNIYGAYLWALDQKWGLEAAAAQASQNEGVASAGFLGDKICREIRKKGDSTGNSNLVEDYGSKDPNDRGQFGGWAEDEIPQGYECARWETRTPGKTVADAISKSVTLDIDWLINADEFNEYLGAIFNAVVNRVIREGVSAMQTSGGSSGQSGNGITTQPSIAVNLGDYPDAIQAESVLPQLISQISLYKENLQKNVSEYQKNSALLNQIKQTQEAAFSTLQSMLQSGCPVPGGASQIDMGDQFTTTCNAAHTNCPCTETRTASTKITAPSSGEAILNRVTTTKWEGYSFSCTISATQSTSTVSISSSSIDSEVQKTNAEISTINSAISKADGVITDLKTYQTEISKYRSAYDVAQNTTGDTSKVSADAMKTAKNKALSSVQELINSKNTDWQGLLDEIMKSSQNIALSNTSIEQKRGYIEDCSYLDAGDTTYNGLLCSAKKLQTDWQAAATACSAGAGSFGISGG